MMNTKAASKEFHNLSLVRNQLTEFQSKLCIRMIRWLHSHKLGLADDSRNSTYLLDVLAAPSEFSGDIRRVCYDY